MNFDIPFYYHAAVLAMLTGTLATLVSNLFLFRTVKKSTPAGPRESWPRVSVLVPARNEARCIARCAGSLAAQDYPDFEVLVLNDHSEDDTEKILRSIGFDENSPAELSRPLRLLHGGPLPPDWGGKNWACHQLSQHATGGYLFFTDADTWHAPEMLASVVAHAQATRADLCSPWPRHAMETWSEKLVIPLLYFLSVALFPFGLLQWLLRHPSHAAKLPGTVLRGLGFANGQAILFKKSAYEKIGGHAAVREHMVEDVALGREIVRRIGEGMRLENCDAGPLIGCRMYRSFGEVWEGFTKNLWPAFEEAHVWFFLVGTMQFFVFVLPFALVCAPGRLQLFAFAEIALIYAIRFILALRFRTSWLGALLHPAGNALGLLIGLNSWWRCGRGGVTWKGRVYRG